VENKKEMKNKIPRQPKKNQKTTCLASFHKKNCEFYQFFYFISII